MRTRIRALASLLSLLAPACDTEDLTLEEAMGPAADELPSQPLPLEGSPSAYGMLRVANELGFAALDGEVGLDRQAAASILEQRAGPDGDLGTADDRYLGSLAELDALYWLGEENLWRIQAFALLEGWVPEALPEGCDPVLADALRRCRAFMDRREGGEPEDARWRCVEEGGPEGSAAAYFVDAGLPGFLDPALGHHVMLCDAPSAAICELGVAGLAELGLSECLAEVG